MNIQCQCGSVIHDSTDDIPNKGCLVPDQGWCAMWDALDAAFDMVAVDQLSSFTAAEGARSIFTEAGSRGIWQCEDCGTLYVEGRDRSLQSFLPSTSETDKQLLRKTSPGAWFSKYSTGNKSGFGKQNRMRCKAASAPQCEHCKHEPTQQRAGYGSQKHIYFRSSTYTKTFISYADSEGTSL